MSANYSFDQYNDDTDFTRNNETSHNTSGYGLLGLIGELGEVIDNLSDLPEIVSERESEVLDILQEFSDLAQRVEVLKKSIRKEQSVVLPNATISNSVEELGGVYWYLNNIAGLNGVKMSDVAKANYDLLYNRFQSNPGWMTNGGIKTH